MRYLTVSVVVAAVAVSMVSGCKSGGSAASTSGSIKINREAGLATLEDNPTSYDRRGEPTLDDASRPAAWVYIDGQEGRFQEREGTKLMEWVIATPVSTTPTFRVRAYEPLLGIPADFSCGLQTVLALDGSSVFYAIAADAGTFEVGKDYSLTNPGPNFTIRRPATDKTYDSIKPLPPGDYIIAAKIHNAKKDVSGLAVTRFTVRAAKKPDAAASK